MYRCCSCAKQITWLAASLSTVIAPVRCDACAVEQHRRQPWLPFIGMAVLALLAAVFAVVAKDLFPPHPLVGLVAVLPLLVVGSGWETWLYRRGEMVATTPSRKRLGFALLLALVAVMVAVSVPFLFKATP